MFHLVLHDYTANMVVGRFFSREKPIVDFFGGSHKDFFRGGTKVVKFCFSLSKLRKQSFFAKNGIGKCQVSKPRRGQGLSAPFPTSMTTK